MGKKSRERRRRGIKWEPRTIDWLIQFDWLEFLPERLVKVRVRDDQKRSEFESPEGLDSSFLESLDAALRWYDERWISPERLSADIQRFVLGLRDKVGDYRLGTVSSAYDYVESRLELPEPLWPGRSEPLNNRFSTIPRWHRLRGRTQLDPFLRWVQLNEGLWTDPFWRESIALAFDPLCLTPLEWIGSDARSKLEAAAAHLHGCNLAGPQYYELAKAILADDRLSIVRAVVASEYLRIKAGHGVEQTVADALSTPTHSSAFFELLMDHHLGTMVPGVPSFGQRNREDYLRYLRRDLRSAHLLTGTILSYLVQLYYPEESPHSSPELPELEEIWPEPSDGSGLTPPRPFRLIAEAYHEELGIGEEIFDEIWSAFVALYRRDSERRRFSSTATVFWAARILEAIRVDVYNAYRWDIDHFHETVQDCIRHESTDDVWVSARTGAFAAGIRSDALLNAVFHTEALQGRDRLVHRPGRGGADEYVTNMTLVFAHAKLKDHWPRSGVKRVNDLLSDTPGVPAWILKSISEDYFEKDPNATGLKANHIFSYLTPLAIAMLGAESSELRPHKVRIRCNDHQKHPELSILLAGQE